MSGAHSPRPQVRAAARQVVVAPEAGVCSKAAQCTRGRSAFPHRRISPCIVTKLSVPDAWSSRLEIKELRQRLAASGQFVAYSPGPNPNHDAEQEVTRWLAVHPRADAAAGFRAGWARLVRFVRPRLREWEGRWWRMARENDGLKGPPGWRTARNKPAERRRIGARRRWFVSPPIAWSRLRDMHDVVTTQPEVAYAIRCLSLFDQLDLTLEELGVLVRRHRADDSVTRAVRAILRARLIVVDDIGQLPVSPDAAEGFYRLVDAPMKNARWR
jgi:hypothetical protein